MFSGGSTLEFTEDFGTREANWHGDEIRCAVALERANEGRDILQIIGLRSGLLLFECLTCYAELSRKLAPFPVAMVARDTRDGVELYMFTVTGHVSLFRGIHKGLDAWPEEERIATLPQPLNVLDVACLDDAEGPVVLTALCHDRLILLRKDRGWSPEEIPIPGGLTCLCSVVLSEDPIPRLMIGAAERSLVFHGLDGSREKLPLAYTPTALAVVKDAQEGTEIFVGFDRGDVHRYRIIEEKALA